MTLSVIPFLQKELCHLDRLSLAAKELLLSNIFYNLGIPVLLTFTNAFILKATNNFNAVAMFMLGTYITLALGFFLNGWLFKFFSIRKIFTAGLMLQGVLTLPIFFVNQLTTPFLFLVGLLLGFPIAFYWANRNFINLSTTTDSNRNYYMGLESLLSTTINIIIPPVIGWLIVYGINSPFISSLNTYRVVVILATLIMGAGGLVLRKGKIPNPVVKKHFLWEISSNWFVVRLIQISRGFQDGISLFLPSMLVIFLVGNEGTLGTLQSITSIAGAIAVYYFGKKTLPKDRLPQITWSVLFSIVVTLIFSIFYNSLTVIIYLLGLTIASTFRYNALSPIILKTLDEEENGDPTNNYAYVADRELFLNIGRISGIGLFYFLSTNISQVVSLRITPLIIGIFQLGIIFLARKISTPSLSKMIK